MAKYTDCTFKDKAKEINPNIDVIGYYVNSRTKIKTKCKKCGTIKSILPTNLLKPIECSYCSATEPHDDFIKELEKVNPNIEILDKYTGSKNFVLAKCLKCEREWNVLPYNLLKGSGCLDCAKRNQFKTQEQYVKEVSEVNPNFEIISKYTKGEERIKVKCKLCNHEWETRADYILKPRKCRNCKK